MNRLQGTLQAPTPPTPSANYPETLETVGKSIGHGEFWQLKGSNPLPLTVYLYLTSVYNQQEVGG